ncbi:MAG: hypothetical protein FGM53_01065 [Rhodocyclaceae bacterium]|nr:hypothetical protein [Rhodocyclaceae bacterium]
MKRPQIPPRASKNYREIFVEELLALWSFLTNNWYYILPGIIALIILAYIVRPIPPSKIRMATGQPNSTFQVIGEQYQAFFKREGIELELIQTAGALENNQRLNRGEVDVAFSQGGLKIDDPDEKIRSLGSIAYQPLWLFYRGSELSQSESLNEFLNQRRVSINVQGSGTRTLAETILQLHRIDSDASNFFGLSTKDSIDALSKGKIDAMFLVAGIESKNLRQLLDTPGIHTFDFQLSDAYSKRRRYLHPIVLPKGSMEFNPVSPKFDVNMVATSVSILTTNNLHPAHQLLFLEAAREIDAHRLALFNGEIRFPAYTDQTVPESDVAQRFYKEGTPFLWGYTPYWLASLFDEIWFYVLAVGAILIPLIGFIPSYRKTHAELSIEECYSMLRRIEVQTLEAQQADALGELLGQIAHLKHRVWRLWVPSGIRPAYYDLRSAVLSVQADIKEKLAQSDQT